LRSFCFHPSFDAKSRDWRQSLCKFYGYDARLAEAHDGIVIVLWFFQIFNRNDSIGDIYDRLGADLKISFNNILKIRVLQYLFFLLGSKGL
jgi:hypothetical protein